jgi:hypothetical protein
LFPGFRKRDGWVLWFGSRRVYRDNSASNPRLKPTCQVGHASVMHFETAVVVRAPLLQSVIRARQRNRSIEYFESRSRRAVVSSRKRAIATAHSSRRYLHIEAVFVFVGRLDHWFAASGQARCGPATFTIERKGIQT